MLCLSENGPLCVKLPREESGPGKRRKGIAAGQPVLLNIPAPYFTEVSHELLSVSGSGIYISGLINHTKLPILLDTGATTSIIDEETWKKSGCYSPDKLEFIDATLTVANGERLVVKGRTNVRLRVGTVDLLLPMVVVKGIYHKVILGTDFFESNGCKICYDIGTFCIKGSEIPIHYQRSSPSVCRLMLTEKIEIQPGTELSITAQLEKGFERNDGAPGMVEKVNNICLDNGPYLARTLVVPQKGKALVRLANFTDKSITLKANKAIGRFYPLHQNSGSVSVFDVKSSQESESCKRAEKFSEINPSEDAHELSEEQKITFSALIEEFSDIIAEENGELGLTDLIEHKIDTGNAAPIKQPPRRLPPFKREAVEEQLEELVKQGRIEESSSPWSSPIVLARKKDGSYRLCIDYRKLNSVTIKDAQPLPRTDDILESLDGAVWFSTLDLASGYWQVPVASQDRDKTAFVTHKGQFNWTCMPFGLTNGPATFQRLMNLALKGLAWKDCLVYLDDIIIWSKNFDEHLERLRAVFERLRLAKVKLKRKKCHFLQQSIRFLGHIVSSEGIQTDPEKTKAVQEWPTPKDVAEVRSFLGLASYYRRFIQDFAVKSEPLRRLLQKSEEFEWTEQQDKAFKELKDCLIRPPILAYPCFGQNSGEFVLDTDASTEKGIGAVLSQVQSDGTERVIAYGSRSLRPPERNYCATRLELLALVEFIHYYRYYLLGRKFRVRTDHHALQWLTSFKEPQGQVARWLEKLQEYDFEIVHRPGRNHVNADAMSRRPRRHHGGNCPSCGDTMQPLVSSTVSTITQSAKKDEKEKGSKDKEPADVLWSVNEVAEAQMKDPDISDVIEHLSKGKDKPSKKELQSKSPMTKSIWAKFELLELKDGVLRIRPTTDKKEWTSRIIIPQSLVKPALKRVHDGIEGGHLGTFKTLHKLQARFWRPGLSSSVYDYVQSCLTCGQCKPPPKKPKAKLISIPSSHPMQRVHIDIIGPLPRTKKGNSYIMTVQCAYTKWAEAYPLRNQRASTCARVLINDWIYRYGVPDSIHTDQGTNFESTLFQEMCEVLEINKTRTTSYHPAGNGQVENFNRTLKSLLKVRVTENTNTWDEYLGACLMAYRSSIHKSTGYTPFHLMFGRETRMPLDIMLGEQIDEEEESYGEFATELKEKLTEAYRQTSKNLQVAQCRQKAYYNQDATNKVYKPGDKVFLYTPQLKVGEAAKFHRFWSGPYIIQEKLSDVNYKIKMSGAKTKVVHYNNIKLSKSRDDVVERKSKSDSECADVEEQRKVESKECESTESSSQEEKEEEDEDCYSGTFHLPVHVDEVQNDLLDTTTEENVDDLTDLNDTLQELQVQDEMFENNADEDQEFEDGSSYRRPQRERRAPQRYGDWVCTTISMKSLCEDMHARLKSLEDSQLKQSKPRWFKKIIKWLKKDKL